MESKEELTVPASTVEEKQRNYPWLSLSGGSYNFVWKSNFDTPQALVSGEVYNGPWVLKYAKPPVDPIIDAMSDKNRSVRLWNEINSDLPRAGLHKKGWVAPYIENTTEASDDEIAQKVVEIYQKTKRIVVDAATRGNFLTRKETGQVVLVDMDLALKRRHSVASAHFATHLNQRFTSYWTDLKLRASKPKTMEVTRNLLYLEDKLSETEIDALCKEGKISLKNIQSLTWFRTNRMKFTYEVFLQLSVLNDLDVPLTDTLLETLCLDKDESEPEFEVAPILKTERFSFFSHAEDDPRARKMPESTDDFEREFSK